MWFLLIIIAYSFSAVAEVKLDFCDADLNIDKNLLQGLAVDNVKFTGSTFFTRNKLLSEASFIPHEKLDWLMLLQSANELEILYRERGFFKAKIQVCLNLVNKGDLLSYEAQFNIEEKPRAKLNKIKFVGNHNFATDLLTKDWSLNGYYHKTNCEENIKKAIEIYHSRGYLDVEVSGPQIKVSHDFEQIDLIFAVKEGPAYHLHSLRIFGDKVTTVELEDWEKKLAPDAGTVLNLIELQAGIEQLLDFYREEGFAFVYALPQITIIDKPSLLKLGSISIDYKIIKGPVVYVRDYLIEGHKKVKLEVIRREIKHSALKKYRKSLLRNTYNNLYQTDYFKSVEILILPTANSDQIDVLIKLVEKPTWFVSVFPVATSDLGFSVAGVFSEKNLFGKGFIFSIATQLSSVDQLFKMSFNDPQIKGTNNSVLMDIHKDKLYYPNFIAHLAGGSIFYQYRLYKHFKVGMNWQMNLVNVDVRNTGLNVQKNVFFPENNFENALGLHFAVNYSNSFLGFSSKVYANYSGKYLGSELTFLDIGILGQVIWYISAQVKLSCMLQVGNLFSLENQGLPITQRYFLGGQGSIRGYFSRSIGPLAGGTFKLLQTIEIEYPIWSRYLLKGYSFVDAGNAFLTAAALFEKSLYCSVGTGLKLMLFQLPLKLEFSVPLTKQKLGAPFDVYLGLSTYW